MKRKGYRKGAGMSKLLLFAGTTEGRELAEFLERNGIACEICVATEYGEQLLDGASSIHKIHTGRLTGEEMLRLMRESGITHVVDATHPYAAAVTQNIRAACEAAGCRYLRLLREESAEAARFTDGQPGWTNGDVREDGKGSGVQDDPENDMQDDKGSDMRETSCIFVDSVQEAVDFLSHTEGNILAATGSKELEKYTQLPNYRERVFARVLSTTEAVSSAAALGFQGRNLICMQGPFDEELNCALLRQVNARYLVTKESGKTGGFPEKARAASKAGARLVVVGRPQEESGYSAAGIRRILCAEWKIAPKQNVSLIGIGMGDPGNMTLEARRACEEADVLIGAPRMLEAVPDLTTPKIPAYLPEEIRTYLETHPEYERAAILLSGDVGFYSGARKLLDCLKEYPVQVYCGISSVVYLCAKLRCSWEDVFLTSIHGRSQNLVGAVRAHEKVFVLVGKQESFRELCRNLQDYGCGDVRLHVGCRLSYADELILSGSPEELLREEPGDLSAVLIENPKPERTVTHGIEDDAFLRAQVPMTKSEIRSISLSKLRLAKDSIVYDVGAGTGSVSVEAALQSWAGKVYAVEKKPEAAELIRQNGRRFSAANLEVIEGTAPQAFDGLPAPTHAFIGGSSGNLREILEILLEKNPCVRVVINAITLETVAEALRCLRELPVRQEDIVAVSVGKAKKAGDLHMMMGQNPVYIISFTGNKTEESL